MAKMLVVVNKLNRRKSPVTDFADKTNVVGILNRDSVFESVDEISNSLGTWHVDRDGYFCWEGGLVKVLT